MMYLVFALVCLALAPTGSFCNEDIHRFMSHEECQQIFHTDHDSVPKYEITKLDVSSKFHKRDLRSGSKMHITAFGENIKMWLHPRDPVLAGEETPVYYAKYSPGQPENVEFTQRHGLMQMVGRIFEDPSWRASLVIGTEESGSARVNGYIGSRRLAVRSLPTRVAEEYRRRRRSVGDFDNDDSPLHVVFQTNENEEEDLSVIPLNVTALHQRIARSTNGRIPDTLYPEVLVVIEHSIYRNWGQDVYGLLQYVLAFMNGVDLKYRSIESPKIRFHISGIVFAEDPEATPYISKHSLGVDVFNTHRALPAATHFFYGVKDSFPLGTYDIPLTITRQTFGVNGSESILGQAWMGWVCKKDDEHQTLNSVTIIKDDGAFSGSHVAAHEIGHLIGAPHDTDKTGDDCLYSNGFLMSFTPWYSTNSSDFSSCSMNRINTALEEAKLDCLFNPPPSAGKPIPELMPGRIKNLEAQCKSLERGIAPCQDPNGPNDVCVNIFCQREDGVCVETGTAALDGTTCGDNKFCLHNQCVSL